MSTDSANNKRIAKNTLLLYFRMLLTMVVSLYTSRVVLGALGVEDYGIYNVVGGVVAMFSMLSGSLSAAISRFITFELGTGNNEKLKRVFSSSVTIQMGLSAIILVLAETVGLWFLNNKMVIPESRMYAANWVFQLSLLTFVINLISIPYNAAIIAHERMSAFAYISIFEA
ncbi:MAG: MATE family efflux transporter, partial [Prevotella sp.]|nr:MATE family efflux transporter [Prevotella sp.]